MNRTSIAAVVLMRVGGAFALGRLTAPEKHLERARADERVTALREAVAAASPLERAARLTKRLAVLDAEDLDRAIALYEREISSLGECEISPFVDAWTEIDPQAAITRISAWPYAQKRILGLQSAVLATASRDASAALPLFQELSERYPRLRPEFHARLLSGWAASNPETLRDHLLALPLDGLGPALGSVLGATARHHGVEFLITWTGQLIDAAPQDETLRAKIFRKAIRTVTRRDPRRAGEWATAHWGTPHGSEGPRIVAEAWILLEPLTAIEWIQTRAPAESRAKALEMAFSFYDEHLPFAIHE